MKNIAKIFLAVILLLLAAGVFIWFSFIAPETYGSPIVLQGTVVTADEILDPGWVVIKGGKIQDVTAQMPDVAGAVSVDTGAIIYPGLINIHDHITWNAFPRWEPGETFLNRYDWRLNSPAFDEIRMAYNQIQDDFRCEMNTYGELRALAGGTTSTIGTGGQLCIRGLVRNLDHLSGFYPLPLIQDRSHIRYFVDLPNDTGEVADFLADDSSEALLVHAAEGIGPAMRAEFDQLVENGLLTEKTAVIHGIALTPEQFQQMASAGASLVWSPRSNLELYGQTADIGSALDAGVRIALGPDWAISGSANLLDELKIADQWNAEYLNGQLSDQQLFEMVTLTPAAIAGIAEEVGSIEPGKFADLLVIEGDAFTPYRALIEAGPEDVQLVLVNGVPLLGSHDLMGQFWSPSELTTLTMLDTLKAIHLESIGEIIDKLEAAFSAQGFDVSPIPEEAGVAVSDLVVVPEPEDPPAGAGDEVRWDEAIYFFGEEKTVCGPVADVNLQNQGDAVPVNLFLGLPYPDIGRFIIFIPPSARNSFSNFPADYYAGDEVCVTGEIVPFQGAAEIILTDPSLLESP